jgi:hypothetical protein
MKLTIRAFRAIDDIETCQRYVEGHSKVLRIYGITMITSAKAVWYEDPDTYVILVASENTEKIYGGARIQVAGNKFPLPIQDALTKFDPSIHQLVKECAPQGTGELCGLWNSREVAGLGIGSIYLSRIGVALSTQLKLNTLFALCAPATVKNAQRVGFLTDERLGNKGTFYYPKEGLVATAVFLGDVPTLKTADPEERERIFELRDAPVQKKTEFSPRGQELELDYHIDIRLADCLSKI